MSYYLAIHEAPCVGVAPVAFEADDDRIADDIAFGVSASTPEFVTGGYDLYRIVWNAFEHKHELSIVVPEEEQFTDVTEG